jgi:hypothetical protein
MSTPEKPATIWGMSDYTTTIGKPMASLIERYHQWRRRTFSASKDDVAWRHDFLNSRLDSLVARFDSVDRRFNEIEGSLNVTPDHFGNLDGRTRRRMVELYQEYLEPRGWGYPLEEGPVDANHSPLPFITYPAQAVLHQIVQPNFKVFEFGCGHSSLWWAARVEEVVSVEHDTTWIKRIQEKKPANLRLILKEQGAVDDNFPEDLADAFNQIAGAQTSSGNAELDVAHGLNCKDFTAYAAALARWPRNYFDVIVVDGMARSLCAYMAGLWVKDDGIVIFDDAGRREYVPGYQALDEMGFGRIDFFGPGPLDTYEWCTSLFVKSLNHFRGTAPRKKVTLDVDPHSPD